jgi:hypothetical protein
MAPESPWPLTFLTSRPSASSADIISDIIRRAEDLPILWESDDSGVACGAPAINVLRCVFSGACEGCRTNNQYSGGG